MKRLSSQLCDQNHVENLSVLDFLHNSFVYFNRLYHWFYTPETFTDKAWSKSTRKPTCDIVVPCVCWKQINYVIWFENCPNTRD